MAQRISDLRNKASKLPSDSKIEISETRMDRYDILIPATGFKGKHTFMIIFAIFWNTFLVFWTLGAAKGSIIFALFSIPFWIVGFLLIRGVYVSVKQSQTIKIEHKNLILSKTTPIWSTTSTVSYNDLNSIEMAVSNQNSGNPFKFYQKLGNGVHQMNMMSPIPTISFGTQEITFAENLSNAEQKYLVDFLNEKIVPFIR